MTIQRMFKNDINRNINGVVQVDQDSEQILIQELNEYVITKELKNILIELSKIMNLPLVDHLIIGDNNYISLKELGYF